MAPRHHVLDIYGAELHLATNKRDWATLRRKHPGLIDATPEAAGMVRFATWHPKGSGITVPHIVLWIDAKAHEGQPAELIDTCAHEAHHAVAQLMERIGHAPSGADEPSAYLCGWLTRWLWEACS